MREVIHVGGEPKASQRTLALTTDNSISSRGLLTGRELQVFASIGRGKTSKEIASDLGITLQTVRSHRKGICRKLRIHSTAELIYAAALAAVHSPQTEYSTTPWR